MHAVSQQGSLGSSGRRSRGALVIEFRWAPMPGAWRQATSPATRRPAAMGRDIASSLAVVNEGGRLRTCAISAWSPASSSLVSFPRVAHLLRPSPSFPSRPLPLRSAAWPRSDLSSSRCFFPDSSCGRGLAHFPGKGKATGKAHASSVAGGARTLRGGPEERTPSFVMYLA
eukprot:scaffold495_cov243-Pinguiococcus_pyrenoidosus.AAC.8